MIPFFFLQTLRQCWLWKVPPQSNEKASVTMPSRWNVRTVALRIIGISSGFLLLTAFSLTILFPAVELPLPGTSDDYNVGIVDLFLPKIEWEMSSSGPATPLSYSYGDTAFNPGSYPNEHYAIRILYPSSAAVYTAPVDWFGRPTEQRQKRRSWEWIPYLRPDLSHAYCEVNMQQGAPPPLKSFGWFTHYWNLIKLPAQYHIPLPGDGYSCATTYPSDTQLLPMIIYSPGLGGSAETYSYQTLSLAARGFVVVVVEHGDGSLAVVPRKDGSAFRRADDGVSQDWDNGNRERHLRGRRAMTEYRADEIIAATLYMSEVLNRTHTPELQSKGVSFRGRLDADAVHFMGHSFGGVSVLHAAHKIAAMKAAAAAGSATTEMKTKSFLLPRPRSVVAHDPASDWIPDSTRRSLFDVERLKDSTANHTYWTRTEAATTAATNVGNYEEEGQQSQQPRPPIASFSIHDFDLFLLFSHEWGHRNWGGISVLQDMHQRQVFGRTTSKKSNNNGGKNELVSVSRVDILDSAHHIEFSDLCMITPTWLARSVGMTGTKSPLETAKDIHTRTLNFLMEVQGQPQ